MVSLEEVAVTAEAAPGAVEPPDEDEREVLDIYAHGDPSARLACQLACTGEVHLTPHPDAP